MEHYGQGQLLKGKADKCVFKRALDVPREKTRGDAFNGRVRQERTESVDDERRKKKNFHPKSDQRTRLHSVENLSLKHTHTQ